MALGGNALGESPAEQIAAVRSASVMIADMIAANGSGVDAVAGATFSSRALRTAVNAAAEQAVGGPCG